MLDAHCICDVMTPIVLCSDVYVSVKQALCPQPGIDSTFSPREGTWWASLVVRSLGVWSWTWITAQWWLWTVRTDVSASRSPLLMARSEARTPFVFLESILKHTRRQYLLALLQNNYFLLSNIKCPLVLELVISNHRRHKAFWLVEFIYSWQQLCWSIIMNWSPSCFRVAILQAESRKDCEEVATQTITCHTQSFKHSTYSSLKLYSHFIGLIL